MAAAAVACARRGAFAPRLAAGVGAVSRAAGHVRGCRAQGLLLITAGAFVVGLSSVLDGSCDSGHVPGYPPSKYPPGGLGRAPPHAADPEDAPTGVAAALALAANALRAGVTGSRESCGHAMSEDAPHPLLGNVLVIAAQIFSALQFVFEEKYVKHYRVPALLAVGLEGFWGLVLCCLALPLFQNIKVRGCRGRACPDAAPV